MKLWLLRHAQVEVVAGVCYGMSDVSANAQSTQEAADAFAAHPALGSVLWSSPLTRAWQLGQALRHRRADLSAMQADARLCEMNFGSWEMQPWEAVPKMAVDAWVADFAHHRFGGGESTQQVIDRVGKALDDACDLNVPEMIWVTHAGVIKAVQYLLHEGRQSVISSPHQWPTHAPAYGAWVMLEI